MRKASRDREENVSFSCIYGWVEVKFLLVAILLVGIIFLAFEIFLKYSYIRPPCSQSLALIRESNALITQGGENYITLSRGNSEFNAPIVRETNEIIASNQSITKDRKEKNHAALEDVVKNNTLFQNIEEKSNVISRQEEEVKVDSLNVIKRDFRAFGSAASVFVQFGAYRGGDNSFAIVGLGSKPLHVYGEAGFTCEWEPAPSRRPSSNESADIFVRPRVNGQAVKFLPDWGYGRVYTVVVINCTFEQGVGLDGQGGKLIVHATSAGNDMATFIALEETSESYAATSAQYKKRDNYTYEFLYCGSSLFGDINPQRMREWLAYHVKLMGPKSHFVFHDAGGVSSRVRQVLLMWQALGHVTLHDIREQARFDGYYYNQFLIVNDCLHRTRFLANWTFFFDVDEYLYVPPHTTLHHTMLSFSNYTQVSFQQSPMSSHLCNAHDNSSFGKLWGIEKLIYRNIKKGYRWDRKYAIQAKNVFATGVHLSENVIGKTLHAKGSSIKYYHYHNTITTKEANLCKEMINATSTRAIAYSDQDPFKIDLGVQYLAQAVKDFELHEIGPQPPLLIERL